MPAAINGQTRKITLSIVSNMTTKGPVKHVYTWIDIFSLSCFELIRIITRFNCEEIGMLFFKWYFTSTIVVSLPMSGYMIIYSVLHCGHETSSPALPFCLTSTQRCMQPWWTHLVVPLQWQGLTHDAVASSSSVAKHTQQYFLLKWNSCFSFFEIAQ